MEILMTLPLKLSRLASHPSTVLGNLWQVNLSPVYANLWTELISIKGLKTTNNKENGRLRLSLRRGAISGRTGTITIGRERIMQDKQGLSTPRQLIQCSESRSVKFWRRLRTNHSSNGQIKWLETLQSAIKTSTAITIRNRDILQRTVGTCGIIWISLSENTN